MNLRPEDLEANGYKLLDKLDHMELVPFVRTYINKWTRFSTIYMTCNLLAFGAVGYLLVSGYTSGIFTIPEGLTYLSYGLVIAFLLLPIHEYIHVLAYKSQGARHTSYDANLKKFYFLAVADRFVANRREFQVVALAPFVVITAVGLTLLFFTTPLWTMTVLGTLLTHTAFCSGDFGLLSYFDFNKNKEVVTYDDKENKISFFYGLERE
jgi:Putative zincin peptidase